MAANEPLHSIPSHPAPGPAAHLSEGPRGKDAGPGTRSHPPGAAVAPRPMGYTRNSTPEDAARPRRIRLVLWVILGLNLAVAAAKYLYGVATASIAMQADGFHSLFDGTSNVVGLIGLAVAVRPPDRDHPYGHAEYETYAAAIIGAMLCCASWKVGAVAWQRLSTPGSRPGGRRLVHVMPATLGVNVGVAAWERRIGGTAQRAAHRGRQPHGQRHPRERRVLAGLVVVRLGSPLADPLLALSSPRPSSGQRDRCCARPTCRSRNSAPAGPRRLRRRPRGAQRLGCHTMRSAARTTRPRRPARPGRPARERGRGAPDRRGGRARGLRALPRGGGRAGAPRALRRVPGGEDGGGERRTPRGESAGLNPPAPLSQKGDACVIPTAVPGTPKSDGGDSGASRATGGRAPLWKRPPTGSAGHRALSGAAPDDAEDDPGEDEHARLAGADLTSRR